MADQDIALMAHLMRRAGFGAPYAELEARVAKGYEATVEELLNPGEAHAMPDDIIRRYHVDQSELRQLDGAGAYWLYRLVRGLVDGRTMNELPQVSRGADVRGSTVLAVS